MCTENGVCIAVITPLSWLIGLVIMRCIDEIKNTHRVSIYIYIDRWDPRHARARHSSQRINVMTTSVREKRSKSRLWYNPRGSLDTNSGQPHQLAASSTWPNNAATATIYFSITSSYLRTTYLLVVFTAAVVIRVSTHTHTHTHSNYDWVQRGQL